jgi:cytoskeletal protein CcmA (bactofilin family)
VLLGADTRVASLESRNGAIRVGASSRIEGNASTRNGKIELDQNVRVSGSLEARNGAIDLASGVSVDGDVKTRNGQIELNQALVKRSVSSRTGDLLLRNGSRVDGDLIIEITEQSGERSWFGFGGTRYPDAGNIELLGDSEVGGDIIVRLPEDYDGELPTVTIDASSRVTGELAIDERVRVVRID